MTNWLLLTVAGFIAGVMNAIAGGGTFVTFSAMVFTGMPSIVANASNAVAMFPASFASAWVYRRDFVPLEIVSFRSMVIASLAGALIGSVLLLSTPERIFDAVVPWLLLAATLVFAFGPKAASRLRHSVRIRPAALLLLQFLIGIYGGYFGGAMGIVMLALYGLLGLTNLNAMNATKATLAGAINGVTVIIFALTGKVSWPQTLVIMGAAAFGGYAGAYVARGINPKYLRAIVTAICVSVTAAFFLRL